MATDTALISGVTAAIVVGIAAGVRSFEKRANGAGNRNSQSNANYVKLSREDHDLLVAIKEAISEHAVAEREIMLALKDIREDQLRGKGLQ